MRKTSDFKIDMLRNSVPDSMLIFAQRWHMVVRLVFRWRWGYNVGPTLAKCMYDAELARVECVKIYTLDQRWANVMHPT